MSTYSLNPLENFAPYPGPLVFIIMDGVGIGAGDETDGVHLAYTPVLDEMMASPLYRELKAHGTAVGQPTDDDMGNVCIQHHVLSGKPCSFTEAHSCIADKSH